MSPRVSTRREGDIAVVTLTRPDKMNAMDPALMEELTAAGEALLTDETLRAVVLHGEGRAFCAGVDVMGFAATLPSLDLTARTHGPANAFQRVTLVWRDVPVPVIAALHGVCFGAGTQIASGADIRIATPDTRLSIMEMKWGLVPDMGGMVTLPPLMRADHIARLTYTAEEITGIEAQAMGLVTSLADDPLAEAMALAGKIASRSPSAIRAAKRLLQTTGTDAERLMAESTLQAALIGKPHQMEAVMANMQKRPPVFE